MSTVRLRDASEYPDAAQPLFALSRSWFNYDFRDAICSSGRAPAQVRTLRRTLGARVLSRRAPRFGC